MTSAPALAASAAPAQEIRAYYDAFPRAQPTDATDLGIHSHDGALEDLSAGAIRREVARLKGWKRRIARLRAPDATTRDDLEILTASIEARLLELERVQSWRHRPDLYPNLATRALYVIIKRDFAPIEDRLRSAIARAEKIPRLLRQGEENLVAVPRVWLDIALEQMPGIHDFFARDVPKVFETGVDPRLRARLDRALRDTAAALARYESHLRTRIAPKVVPSFALGEELFRAKLLREEMVDTPIPVLLARGEAELARLQQEFRATAARIDPRATYVEVQAAIQKDHPTADAVIRDTQARLKSLRQFVADRGLMTLPKEGALRVEETPPFMRATTFASMSNPGPFEQRATEAFYNVTLPDPGWPAERIENFLASVFSRPLIDVVSIHEAYPGHYVQYLWLARVEGLVRKYESAGSNAEGWAHYCEQMLLDQGYRGGDDRVRLAQLQDALLRAARYVVGIRLHTRGMTFKEAVELFQREGLQSPEVALMEAKRGTTDPTYLVYTLGKLEILRLRDDCQAKWGSDFSLKRFHDAFLAQGVVPLPIVRRALLGR